MEADTLSEALTQLTRKHPRLRPVLLDGSGHLQRVHQVLLNGELISSNGDRPLRESDEIELVTAASGI
ncbi:MoaD/ThiS family protein [Streptomyces sp. ISL-86]|nr:MoaD/ThiS family protein [Streptomyces sp. ISL-86]